MLDLSILFIGCVLSPRRMLRAFVRGRHSKNLYALGWNPARLNASVGELRRELGVDQAPPAPSVGDLFAFAGWVALSTLYSLGGSLSLVTFAFAMWKTPQAQLAGGPPANSPTARPLPVTPYGTRHDAVASDVVHVRPAGQRRSSPSGSGGVQSSSQWPSTQVAVAS